MESKGKWMKLKTFFLGLSILFIAGCAASSYYVNYTNQRFPPKDKFYDVAVYSQSQNVISSNPYYVIGKVAIEGFASNGVSPETLTRQAKVIARKRGADAIINARTEMFRYYGGDALLRFKAELIVYAPAK